MYLILNTSYKIYMKYYFAPMEGITGYIYRNAYQTFFHKIDKYYSPFIVAKQNETFKSRELNDILPENNKGLILIPQLLTNNSKEFIYTSKKIKLMGYNEINLNLGCPSGTVVSKNRGSGFLSKKEDLDRFLEEIFMASVTDISIKTRLGIDQPEEFYEILEIYNKYPLKELIIHPRVQKDFYNNKPNLTIFSEAFNQSKNPVCYNGDIFSVNDYHKLLTAFPDINTIMFGRGLLMNPGLISEIIDQKKLDKPLLKDFHDKVYEDYQGILSGERNVLFKMKEFWFYLIPLFTEHAKYAKKIKKAEKLSEYDAVVTSLFKEQEITHNIS